MTRYLLFILFLVLFSARTVGIDLSLAPGLSVKNAFLYLIFVGMAIETAITRGRRMELVPVLGPFALYAAYATFTWLVAVMVIDYPGYGARSTLMSLKAGPIENLMVLLVFFYGILDRERAMWTLRAIVWTVMAGNLVSVIDTLNIPDLGMMEPDWNGRLAGPFGWSNQYGSFLAFFLPAICALFWIERGFWRLVAGIGLIVSAVALLLTVSRGAFVGLAAGSIAAAFYLRSLLSPQVIFRAVVGVALVLVIAVAGAVAAGYGEVILERFGLFGAGAYGASSGRTLIWARALGSMMEHPITFLTGFGWDAYGTIGGFGFAAHSSYISILYDLGAIGLLLFLVVMTNIVRTLRRSCASADGEARAFLMALVFGLLSLLVCIVFGELYIAWLYIWAFIGLSLRVAVSAEARAAEPEGREAEELGGAVVR